MKRSVLLALVASLLLSGSAMAEEKSVPVIVNVPSREHPTPSIKTISIFEQVGNNFEAVETMTYDSSNLIYDETEPGYLATRPRLVSLALSNYEEGNWTLTVQTSGLINDEQEDMGEYIYLAFKAIKKAIVDGKETKVLKGIKFKTFKQARSGVSFTKKDIPEGVFGFYCTPKVKGYNCTADDLQGFPADEVVAIPKSLEGKSFSGTIEISLSVN